MTNYLTAAQIASMRATVLNTQLDHVCTVKRNNTPVDDAYDPQLDMQNLYVGRACHYWEEAEEEIVGEANALVTNEKIVFAANTDITEKDLITTVTGYDGATVASNLNVLEVIKHVNHVLAVVRGNR